MRNIDWPVEDTHWKFVTSWRDGYLYNYPRKPRPGEVLLSDDDGNHAIYRLDGRGVLEAWKLWASVVNDSDIYGEAVIMGTYPNFYIERKQEKPARSYSPNWIEPEDVPAEWRNESNPISDEIERIVYVDECLCFKCSDYTAGIGVEVIWQNGNYLAVICGHCGSSSCM